MVTALEVASWFVRHAHDEGDSITQLKLQKLCYYAQGYHLAIHGEPLFDDAIEAWDKGPVIYSLRREYGRHKGAPIPSREDGEESFADARAARVLAATYREFRDATGSMLVSKTHRERPWLAAREGGANSEIAVSHMLSHFKREFEARAEECPVDDIDWFSERMRADESLRARLAANRAGESAGRSVDLG